MQLLAKASCLLLLAAWTPFHASAQASFPDTLVYLNGARRPVQVLRLESGRLHYASGAGWRTIAIDSLSAVIGSGTDALRSNALIIERKSRERISSLPERQSLLHYANTRFSDYQPLQSTGAVPLDLREYYLEAQEQAVRDKQKRKNRFVKDNTVAMGYLFATGRVLYNDPISLYMSEVLDTLLHADAALRARLRVFCIRAAAVNAYTSNDGKIFVTLGLLARLKSRAELAFVLAHEVQHYLNGDVYESFVLNHDISKRMKSLTRKQESAAQLLRTKYRRSRQQEVIADSAGVLLYRSSPYGKHDPGRVFDVLERSEGPVYPQAPDGAFFGMAPEHFDDILNAELQDRALLDGQRDASFDTHPAIDSRRAMLHALSDGHAWTILAHDPSYDIVRDMAGFELAHTYFIDGEFALALIQANGLLGEYPDNPFLNGLSVKCLLAIAEIADDTKDGRMPVALDSYSDAAIRAFNSTIGRLTSLELYASVIHRCAMLPAAEHDLDMRHSVAIAARALNESGFVPETVESTVSMAADSSENANNVVDTLASEHDEVDPAEQERPQPAVVHNPDEAETAKADRTVTRLEDMIVALMSDTVAAQLLETKDHWIIGPWTRTGHVVIPFIMILDTLGKPRILDPQHAYARYCREIEQLSSSKKRKVKAMSSFGLDSTDTREYNEFCFYQDQLQAFLANDQQPFVLDRDELYAFGERHDARYLTLSFVLMTRNRLIFKLGRWLMFGFLIPGGAGLVIGTHALLYKYTGKQFTVVYDLTTGSEVHAGYERRRTYLSANPSSRRFYKTMDKAPR